MILVMNYSSLREIITRILKFLEHEPNGVESRTIVAQETRMFAEMKSFVSAITEGMKYNELKNLTSQFDGINISMSDRGEDFRGSTFRGAPVARHEVRLERHGFSISVGLGNTPENAVADAARKLKERYRG